MKKQQFPNPLVYYTLRLLAVISLTAVVDGLLIVPMVEIDPALTILSNRSPELELLRAMLPTLSSILYILSLILWHGFYLKSILNQQDQIEKVRNLILKAPRFYGFTVASGWGLAFLVSAFFDAFTLTIPIPGEALAYYLSSAIAMVSTGIFGMIAAWIILDDANRKVLIPFAFPEGYVSRTTGLKTISIPQLFLALWFAASFFPLLVLSLGFFTRQYLPQNDLRALIFVLIFIPTSVILIYRVGQSTQKPLQELVQATSNIARGKFQLSIKSIQNDDIGYLIDSTLDMAHALEEKERISETFGRVVDPRVRDHLLAGNIDLGGTKRIAAIMFCDIRGFTSLSEFKSEEEVVHLLNEHLTAMERAIQSKGGMINKFLGDGFLAIFGAPLDNPTPAFSAFQAARELSKMNETLNTTRVQRGDPSFTLGVGIHLGPVIAGNIGSTNRSEYTVIGDTVNLASRVEGLSKRLGVELVITDAVKTAIEKELQSTETLSLINLPRLMDRGYHEIRGRQHQIRVWTLDECLPSGNISPQRSK